MNEESKSQLVGNTEWDGLQMPKRLWAILAVTFGVTLSVLDSAIANVALPTIGSELGVSSADSIWVVNAYQLAIMISLLSFSALGELVGYRKIYQGGLIVFTLASVGCALSTSLSMLIITRMIQGFGAAAIMSLNTTLIRLIYPRRYLGRGLGLNATIVAVASVAGPTIAAGILSVTTWHWLFAVNIPVGIIALILGHKYLPQNPVLVSDRHFSKRDSLMNALTFGLLIAVIEGYSHGISIIWLALGICALLIIGYLFVHSQMDKPYPILPIDLMRIPIFSISVVTSICSFIAQMLALISLPFFLQRILGYTEVETGFLMTAWPAIIMLVAPLAGILISYVHAGILGGIGLIMMSIGLFLLAFMPEGASEYAIVWRLMLCGAGFGFFQSPNNSILLASAPAHRSGSASGMLATARLIGQTTGAALVAFMFHTFPNNSMFIALFTAGFLALVGAVISCMRLSLSLPDGLKKK